MDEKEIKTKNIFEKIQLVSNEIKNIEKNKTVGTGNSAYKAVQDIDVTLEVKKAEAKYRLVSIPVKQELVKSEIVRTVKKEGYEVINYVDIVKMTLHIVNLDDTTQTIDIESFGRGLDTGDKGFGKASTYARKYALLNAYKITTGEDPDENKSEEQRVMTESDMLVAVRDYLMKNIGYASDIASYFNVSSITELTQKQLTTIYKDLKKKGRI